MIKHLMASTALAALLATGPALAQQAPSEPQQPPAAQQDMQQQDMQDRTAPGAASDMDDDASDAASTATAPDSSQAASSQEVTFLTSQETSDWRLSEITGANVENAQGENLGAVSELILDDQGSIRALVVGVGGFLGIGQKLVAVPFESVSFRIDGDTGVGTGTMTSDRATDTQATAPAPGQTSPAQPGASGTADTAGTSGAPGATGMSGGQSAMADRPQLPARTMGDSNANLVIVLNTMREDLEAAPTYEYLRDQSDSAGQTGTGGTGLPGSAD